MKMINPEEEIKSLTIELISFYKENYKKRFSLFPDEKFDEESISRKIEEIVPYTEGYKDLVDILKKAILWYVYRHDTSGENGIKYPYKLNLFFKQSWLFHKCIQASSDFNFENLESIINSGLNEKEFTKAAKRGDVISVGKSSENLREKALKLFYRFELELEGQGQEQAIAFLKKNDKIKEIFKSMPPSEEYCNAAIEYLEKMMKIYVSKNI